ncbi:MAG TPA: GcrA family cell cycle regulator, partial [Terriglobales bacterium]|nr:GcrA family cell cycle regulator [Terriglobales bacterium]
MEWTEQRIETLRKLWGQGQTASQIAAILGGITRNAVIGKAHRLGLTGRPSPIKREAGSSATPTRRKASTTRTERPSRPAVMTSNSPQPASQPVHQGVLNAPAVPAAQARPA